MGKTEENIKECWDCGKNYNTSDYEFCPTCGAWWHDNPTLKHNEDEDDDDLLVLDEDE
jgi:rRNA maturation endonuclease Nob1